MPIDTISNLGTGAEVFAQLVSNDAQFRSIAAAAGVTVAQNIDDIDIAVDQAFAFTWTATQNFGTASADYSARFDPNLWRLLHQPEQQPKPQSDQFRNQWLCR